MGRVTPTSPSPPPTTASQRLPSPPQMFVRLFVDENLDRMVPISKQPKEKIQAIIESCSRQFPEFQERARKRIRTYLKSCRRMKKNGMEMVSATPGPAAPRPALPPGAAAP